MEESDAVDQSVREGEGAVQEAPRYQVRTRAREASSFMASLLDLPALAAADRRVAFRQVIAELARASTEEGPSPLEGIRAEALVTGAGAALEAGLVDDLDWLEPGAAGCALYQLAAALPVGAEQRELGRRVFSRLLEAKSDAFARMATQMARAGGKGLLSPPVFARVALLVELPINLDMPDAPLAFAIASRRNLAREYVTGPSTRSLPERRLAARILERAARDALRRMLLGDRSGARVIGPDGPLQAVWRRLLADREPLVWRHVAIARGLLCASADGVAALEDEFSPKLTPTEWRRAAAGLGGLAASKPEVAVRLATRVLREGLLTRDPGAIAPYLWGLARAAESEPEAARELFDLAVGTSGSTSTAPLGNPVDVAEAVLSLERELGDGPFMERARARARALMSTRSEDKPDDGTAALRAELIRCLERGEHADPPLAARIDLALRAFAEDGARAAYGGGLGVLDVLRADADALAAIDDERAEGAATSLARRTAFTVVRDLDVGLLERDALLNLLRLEHREARVKAGERELEQLRDRIFVWLLHRELDAVGSLPSELPHAMLHLGRMKAMLHLLDGETFGRSEDEAARASAAPSIERFRKAARSLIGCFSQTPPPILRRALMATLARCLDALARSGACDTSDVVLVIAGSFSSAKDLETLAEATMDPDTRGALSRLATIAKTEGEERLAALESLAEELASAGTARSDGVRAVVTKLSHALGSMARAASLGDIASSSAGDAEVILSLENACFGLAQVQAGAKTRVLDVVAETPRAPSRDLSTLFGKRVGSEQALGEAEVIKAVLLLIEQLPDSLTDLIRTSALRVASLPLEAAELERASSAPPERREPQPAVELPAWVPARRALGAFYVERPLADGGVGSVFVVSRYEDRNEAAAERFALKVPDYNANAARHLSETEFLQLFRSEASALMALPPHPNLATFVTFDLAARPKPILVMELVEGPNLERLIDTRTFDVDKAMTTLDQVARGLEAMHEAEVGHLDLKPANVVLRDGATAVLVDFGLAGRKLRLGCGSAPYSAPEVWGHVIAGSPPTPMAADVYSFACLTFEAFTGQLLFDGETEVALVSSHISHDGLPPKLRALAQDPRYVPLAELLFAALRRDPTARLPIRELRKELPKVTNRLKGSAWPVPVPGHS